MQVTGDNVLDAIEAECSLEFLRCMESFGRQTVRYCNTSCHALTSASTPEAFLSRCTPNINLESRFIMDYSIFFVCTIDFAISSTPNVFAKKLMQFLLDGNPDGMVRVFANALEVHIKNIKCICYNCEEKHFFPFSEFFFSRSRRICQKSSPIMRRNLIVFLRRTYGRLCKSPCWM